MFSSIVRFSSLAGLLSLALTVTEVEAEATREKLKFFETKIRPLLVKRCYKCHGDGKAQGGLQFGSRESLLKGGESGEAVIPGNVKDSLIVSAVNYDLLEMPPDKQLSRTEIRLIEQWVKDGAVWPATDKNPRAADRITEKDRQWWAFQPVLDPHVPKNGSNWARNEIDHFIAKKLDARNIKPAPPAAKRTLIRRLYQDLIGLPPNFEQIQSFVNDTSPDAYTKVVKELLASQSYGERWARHWLDLVRYSESDGYRKDDFRPTLWRYRDYVIRSFNEDKPYNQFVAEQIAGDEIAPNDPDARVATAYWRLYLYEYNQRDVRTHWKAILDETTDVTAEVFLGMGLACARCHDHKFDPLLRKDYYRFQAFFSSILPQDNLPIAPQSEIDAFNQKQAVWESKTQSIRDEIDALLADQRAAKRASAIEKFPPDIRIIAKQNPETWTALDRQLMDLVERQVAFEYSRIALKGEAKTRLEQLQKQLSEFDSLRPQPLPVSLTVTDAGRSPARTVIPGGKNDIKPGQLSVLDPTDTQPIPSSTSTGRRTALANWLTDPKNPLTARVITNRVWQYHFGTGLVATTSDFGSLGERPSHPELLDWLTTRFVENGWSIKYLNHLIVNSATYQTSANHPDTESIKLIDPQNRLRWRWDLRRLEAEQIRDAILHASGELNRQVFGSPVSANSTRRSIYLKLMRNSPDTMLSAFDVADGFNSTARRDVTTTSTQSLLMMNGDWLQKRAVALANRIDKAVANDESNRDRYEKAIQNAWRFVYGRGASAMEVEQATEFLKQVEAETPTTEPSLQMFAATKSQAAAFSDSQQPHRWVTEKTAANELPASDFTVEAVVQLRSMFQDASVRTIVSQWNSSTGSRGWSLGVTSAKSAYQPRNLIVQLVGSVADEKSPAKYEVIASNLRPELGKPYYVAVAIDLDDTSDSGITFYLKDLSDPKAKLQKANVKHSVTANYRPSHRLVVGGRDVSKHHRWDGLIDNVRITRRRLAESDLLISNAARTINDVVGFWKFNSPQSAGKSESSKLVLSNANALSQESASGMSFHTLQDLSHVLLNSSEFLYVD